MNFNNFFKKRNSQKESKVIHIENDKIWIYVKFLDTFLWTITIVFKFIPISF